MLDIAEGRAISTTSVALSQLLQYGNYNYLQPCYSIHCAEVLEAKVGPIIHLCGIATVFRARRMEGTAAATSKDQRQGLTRQHSKNVPNNGMRKSPAPPKHMANQEQAAKTLN